MSQPMTPDSYYVRFRGVSSKKSDSKSVKGLIYEGLINVHKPIKGLKMFKLRL